jgi:hypothetical protein
MREEMEAQCLIYDLTEDEKKNLGELARMKRLLVHGNSDSIEAAEWKGQIK